MKISDTYKLLLLFLVSIAFRYFTPDFFGDLFFLTLFLFFIFDKPENNYFWLMLLWLLIVQPGFLFSGTNELPNIYLPAFGRGIRYHELFVFAVIIKAIFKPTPTNFFYSKFIWLIIGYAIFLMVYGFFLGTSTLGTLKTIRYFIPLLLFIFIPKILPYNQILLLLKLLFVSIFILFFSQLVDIVMGKPLAAFFGGFYYRGEALELGVEIFNVNTSVVRTIYGPFIILIGLITSLILTVDKNNFFSQKYLNIIIFTTTASIFLSATRGWILAALFILLIAYIINIKKISKVLISGFLLAIIAFSIPKINKQINNAFERVLTLEAIVEGDATAGGTLTRLTERGPRVMNKFYESPVFGFGFSNEFYEYWDGHVGNQTLLLNGGVVGYLLYIVFLFKMISFYYSNYKINKNNNLFLLIALILCLVIIHSSSRIIFLYSLGVKTALALSFMFYFSDYVVKQIHYKKSGVNN